MVRNVLLKLTVKDDKTNIKIVSFVQEVELTTSENKRGAISKRVTEIYSN